MPVFGRWKSGDSRMRRQGEAEKEVSTPWFSGEFISMFPRFLVPRIKDGKIGLKIHDICVYIYILFLMFLHMLYIDLNSQRVITTQAHAWCLFTLKIEHLLKIHWKSYDDHDIVGGALGGPGMYLVHPGFFFPMEPAKKVPLEKERSFGNHSFQAIFPGCTNPWNDRDWKPTKGLVTQRPGERFGVKRILASHIVTLIGSGRLPRRVRNGGALFIPCWTSKIAHKPLEKHRNTQKWCSQNFGANFCLVFSAAKNVFFWTCSEWYVVVRCSFTNLFSAKMSCLEYGLWVLKNGWCVFSCTDFLVRHGRYSKYIRNITGCFYCTTSS